MSSVATAVARKVPKGCHATQCKKDGCMISLASAPQVRVIIDLDCNALSIPQTWKRCDYLFVGEDGSNTWVSPIELKSGKFSVSSALDQLGGGVKMADTWLPPGISFQFVPILAHGRTINREERRRLLSRTIALRGKKKKTMLIKSGEKLEKALGA